MALLDGSTTSTYVAPLLQLISFSNKDGLELFGCNVFELIEKMPVFGHDPFVGIVIGPKRSFPIEGDGYSYWEYLISLLIFAPALFFTISFVCSILTSEWSRYSAKEESRKEMRRQAWLTASGLMASAPGLAFVMKALFEMKIGRLHYNTDSETWVDFLIGVVGFYVIHDFAFYSMHRLWHTSLFYKWSHHIHHSCRPTTTFAASAADAFEISFTGYISVLLPAFILPISARTFIFLDITSHFWSIYVHNNDAHEYGFFLYDPHDHNVHHYYGQQNFNFGLFTQIPDRLFGTFKRFTPSGRLSQKSSRWNAKAAIVNGGTKEE
eukprot:m.15965 g.15965  ORF g.15965 m.15965 type:complete len:323 (+) comp4549_c0_seq1:164-1132(+)